jgi:hypothetical protein
MFVIACLIEGRRSESKWAAFMASSMDIRESAVAMCRSFIVVCKDVKYAKQLP